MHRERVRRLWILHAQSVPRHGLWERRELEPPAERPSAKQPERVAPLNRSAAPQLRSYE